LAVYSHPQSITIGNELDGAVLIRAVNIVLPQSLNQPVHHLRAWVVKGIICSNANHRHFRVDRSQKLLGGGGLAAVMGYLGD
jgi:hypothetical protein